MYLMEQNPAAAVLECCTAVGMWDGLRLGHGENQVVISKD